MATDCIPQVTFEFYDNLKPVVARFDQTQASTDGGVVLLKALDDRLRLTDQLAVCLVDRRDPDKIRHPLRDLLRQRIFGLACGYEDGNDAARLADDPQGRRWGRPLEGSGQVAQLRCPQLCSVQLRGFRSSPWHRPSRIRVFSGCGVGSFALSRTSHPSGSRRWSHPFGGCAPAPGTHRAPENRWYPAGSIQEDSRSPGCVIAPPQSWLPAKAAQSPAHAVRGVAEGMGPWPIRSRGCEPTPWQAHRPIPLRWRA